MNFIERSGNLAIYNGDILFCSGTSPISKEIKRVTKSEYSHVGLLFTYTVGTQRVVFVIEAINPVITIVPLEQYFTNYKQTGKPYPGKLFLGRLHGGLTLEQSAKIHFEAVKHVGKGYDNASILKQAFNYFFKTELQDEDQHRLICSELVALVYKAAGIPMLKDDCGFYTPGSLGADSKFIIAELKNYEVENV